MLGGIEGGAASQSGPLGRGWCLSWTSPHLEGVAGEGSACPTVGRGNCPGPSWSEPCFKCYSRDPQRSKWRLETLRASRVRRSNRLRSAAQQMAP